jgi:hypothetical protein
VTERYDRQNTAHLEGWQNIKLETEQHSDNSRLQLVVSSEILYKGGK